MSLPNLSPHLHTEECNAIIAEYHKCTEEAGIGRFFDKCGKFEGKIRKCMKKQKLDRYFNNKPKSGRIGD